jgi:hypothetical protein
LITCPRASSESLCHACQLGHHIRLAFPTSSRVVHAFDLIRCDLWTSPVPNVSGYKYYLVILDDCTHYSWTFPPHHKSNAFPTLSHFFAYVSTQFSYTIRSVQCDNGCEFDNSSTRTFFLSHGVQLRMSCPYTSPQNDKAERMIRTTNDVMRSLLFQSSFRLATGLRAFTLPPTSSTFCPSRPSQPPPLLRSFRHHSLLRPPTGLRVRLLPEHLCHCSPQDHPSLVSFLGTPLSTRGTGVSISARTACWSPGTLSSTSHSSPLPPPAPPDDLDSLLGMQARGTTP